MQVTKSSERPTAFVIALKLLIAVALLAATWSSRSAQAEICDEAQNGMLCFTMDEETGNQTCQDTYDSSQFELACKLTDLGDGMQGCTQTLCPPPHWGGFR